jgi:hypothetical protein
MTTVSSGLPPSTADRGTSPQPRSLAEDLRARTDAQLTALLRQRPDLAAPVPADLTTLAAAATARPSVQHALERLDTFATQVVEVLVCLPDPTTADAVLGLLTGTRPDDPTESAQVAEALPGVLAGLRERALLWGPDDALRLVRTVRDVVGPHPAGIGPPLNIALSGYSPGRLQEILADAGLPGTHDPVSAVAELAELFSDPARLAVLLDGIPDRARDLLDRLAWGSSSGGPPLGEVRDAARPVRAASARSAVEWLLARGLLAAVDATTVTLPRQVALYLRGGRLHQVVRTRPPALPSQARDLDRVDHTAAGSALTAVRQVEDLLELWGAGGPPVLRAGGLGVRELRRAAAVLDVEEPVVALWAELAYAAGLLGPSGDVDEVWLPTPGYDQWLAGSPQQRWATLAEVWRTTSRVPGLVGTRDEKDRPVSGLGPDVDRAIAPQVRARVLAALASLPAGHATTLDGLRDRLDWEQPKRSGPLRTRLVGWVYTEAERLGVTGLGALTTAGRALLDDTPEAAANLLAPLLPEPVDHVLLQADLTAIAPGPLTPELAREITLCADVESTGGATVYRFSESSIRRALDAGRVADDLHGFLAAHARTPVPQPLAYLIADVARRHGRVRAGVASAYLRCDDEAVVAELAADRRAQPLGLRRLAPTVLVSTSPVDMVLERLRAMGYAPMAESAAGEVVVTAPQARRTSSRQRPPRLTADRPGPSPELLAAAVKAIRAGDRAATAPRRPLPAPARAEGPPRGSTAQSLAALALAVTEQRPLWIGYVNAEGRASQRVIEPIQVEGGYVRAFDHLHDEVRTFAVHRITGVATLGEDWRDEIEPAPPEDD